MYIFSYLYNSFHLFRKIVHVHHNILFLMYNLN